MTLMAAEPNPIQVPTRPRRFWWPSSAVVGLLLAGCGGSEEAGMPAGIERQPFATQNRGADAPGTTRFRLVPPEESGLAFVNRLRRENRYTYLTNGAGLAVGDYDGDGMLDAYLVSQDGPNKLFRQVAPLQFDDVTASAGDLDGGEAWGTGASFADIDGDGDLDLYVCNMEAPNRLYRNEGDGTFREDAKRFGLDIVAASTMPAFADYDCDGKLDLYLVTNRALHAGWTNTPEVLRGFRPPGDTAHQPVDLVPTSADWSQLARLSADGKLDQPLPKRLAEHFLTFRGRVYTAGQPDRLLRNVNGKFVDVTSSAGIRDQGMGLSATWCDYDNDGYPDLYVANDLESPDVLYHNERDGSFRDVTKEVVPHTAYYGMGSDAADVDGDGDLDLMVADMSMTTHKKAKVLMGDMDQERPVLMYADPPQVMRNALLVNTGMGSFEEAAKLAGVASTDWTWSVLFGDLDQDSRVDLFATNGIARFDTDPDLKIRVEQLWQEGRQQAAIEVIQNVAAVPEKNVALKNQGDLEFVATDWGLDLEAVSHGAALADFDGDGDLDVLVHNFESPASLYENRTTEGNAIIVRLRGQRSERFGVGARVEVALPDGRRLVRELRLARGYLSGQAPELHFGLGDAAAFDLTVRWPSGHRQSFEGLSAQASYTITESAEAPGPDQTRAPPTAPATLFQHEPTPPFRHQENAFDEYAAQPLLPAQVARQGPALAAADGWLFVGGARGQAGALLRRDGDGWRRIEGPWREDASCEDVGACIFDADGDGDLDLYVSSGGSEVAAGDALLRDRLYRNQGGSFARDDAAFPDIRDSTGRVTAADVDGDSDLDLIVAGRLVPGAYPDAPPTRLYRNDGGTFTDATEELAPALLRAGMVYDVLVSDANGDGKPDLLVAAHWQPLRLLQNNGEGFVDQTKEAGLAEHRGWWNCLCACDVDGDGDVDYLAGNQGWNTKYSASAARPARLYYGDFDDDGRRDLVEAKYEGNRLLPVRGRSCSSGAMPMIAKKFPTYDQFASSLLKDIYTEDKLNSCGEVFATELASCLLRNDGNGTFTVEPLPRRAQIAPINAMVLLDDWIICAQNNHSPEPETGRHDGGTGLVLARGPAGLRTLPAREHGIVLFGDCRNLVEIPDETIVFGVNDDRPQVFALRRPD